MKYDNVEKNKVYEKTSMSDAEKKELLANCLKKREEILSEETNTKDEPISDFIVKRNEKMNKNDGIGRVFKYVGVAAFAVIATGAILSGMGNYQNNKTKPAKESIIATTEKDTDKIEENIINNEEVTDNSTYKQIGPTTDGTYYLDFAKGKEIGGALFKYGVTDNSEYLYVKGKNGKKYIEVCEYYPDIYTNGEYVYYTTEGILMRYDVENEKSEKFNIIKADKNAKKNNAVEGTEVIEVGVELVRNDDMYMNYSYSWEDDKGEKHNEYGIYVYNMVSGEARKIKSDRYIEEVYNSFFITKGPIDEYNDNEENALHEHYIEKMDGDKLKEVLSIGEQTELIDQDLTISKKYFYFIKYKVPRDEIDTSELKLIRVAKDKAELEEVATLKSSDFVGTKNEIQITEVTDEFCEVEVTLESEVEPDVETYEHYMYMYATKRIEKLEE